MGRAALGAAAKTKTGAVRVTEHEFAYFQRTYGGLGKFLQAKVNEELSKARQMEDAKRADISPRQVMK